MSSSPTQPNPPTAPIRGLVSQWSGWRKRHGRFIIHAVGLIISSLLLRYVFTTGPVAQPEVMQILVGSLVAPLALLLVTGLGYLVLRHLYYYLYRKSVEERARADLQLPTDVRKVTEFDQISLIDKAQHELLPVIAGQQGRYRAFALTTQVAASLAVLIVVLQQVIWPATYFGGGLLLGEAVLLCYVLVQIILNKHPTAKWVLDRTKAEILRRDQYLALGRVGPFASWQMAEPEIEERVRQIATATGTTIESELSSEDDEPLNWLSDIISSGPTSPLFDDLPDRVRCYRHKRIGNQIGWMNSGARDVDGASSSLFATALLAALVTFGVSIFGFVNLAAQLSQATFASPTVNVLNAFRIVGLFLPALMGAILAVRSVFNLGSLSRNYKFTASQLIAIERTLTKLEREVEESSSPIGQAQLLEFEQRFRKLIVRGEQTLLDELVRWRIITDRDGFDV